MTTARKLSQLKHTYEKTSLPSATSACWPLLSTLNSQLSVDGGFWGIIAVVQTPGAPLLTITRTTANTVAVSWPSPATGFTLQQNTNSVSSLNWSNVVPAPSDDGTTRIVIVNPPVGNRFYRLVHP